MADAHEAWSDFLNPDMVRLKFVSAGLFMVAHETLTDSIKRHPLGFFSEHFDIAGPKPSRRYKEKVLSLDPKGKMDPWRGSIAWLRSMDVIDADDEQVIHKATVHRNKLAHELMGLMAGQAAPDYLLAFEPVYTLIAKIERWWIVNLHMDFMDEELPPGGEVDDIVPGPIMSLQMLAEVALTEGDAAWDMHKLFEKARSEREERDKAGDNAT